MQQLILSITVIITLLACHTKKQMCTSIDDLPMAGETIKDSIIFKNIFTKTVISLKQEKVPAIGFINEIGLFEQDSLQAFRLALIAYWHDQKLQLGNHTFSHLSFHNSNLTAYENNIIKGKQVTASFFTNSNQKNYFRPPFLHTGATKSANDSFNILIAKHNYLLAPVTIDNEDYLYAAAYEKAINATNKIIADRIIESYLQYMEAKIIYFENIEKVTFNKSIPQILLLHMNRLNADCMHALLKMIKQHKYKFITIEKALKNKAYQTEVTVFKDWGISWLERWALSKKIDKKHYKNDPAVAAFVIEYLEN